MANKKAARRKAVAVLIVLLLVLVAVVFFGVRPASKTGLESIQLPPGFKIEFFADDLGGIPVSYGGPNPGPRMMLLKGGVLFVTIPSQGRVVALADKNGDNKADGQTTFIGGLNNPHGIDFYDGWFYVAEEDRVIRVRENSSGLVSDPQTLQVLVDMPSGGEHYTRTLKIYNGSMYVSVGSSCNVCHEQDERRAAILKCGLDGTDCRVFASGLRNAVGFVFNEAGSMYATENGRDNLGDDLPPDEINLLEDGRNYGWPICYGKNVHDADFDKNVYVRNPCMEPFEVPSLIDLPAHSAPLGIAFYYGKSFPEQYAGKLFVAYHGSWDRKVPTGYKIVVVDLDTGAVEDFATGWLQGGVVSGRPVDIIVAGDGSLLVSDDNAGRIYRIYYAG